MTKVSHWNFREGRAQAADVPSIETHESEDLRHGFSASLRVYGEVRLSQKNGCGVLFGRRSILFSGGFL